MKAMVPLILLISLILIVSACSNEESVANAEQSNPGKPAPVFELTDLEGKTHDLSEYAGKKVYVKFWASWCSICLAGMEELNTLAGEENDFVVLSIVSPSSNAEKDSESFKKWFKGVENTENIQVLLDEGGTFFDKYGVLAYPTSAYIGSDGTLVKSSPGHFSNAEIKETFESIN